MKSKFIFSINVFSFLFAVIVIWGILLRIPELLANNYLFGHDHGRDYLAAYNIVENHKLTLIGSEVGSGVAGINGIFHGPGYIYLIALVYILFHGDPLGGQILMLLSGILLLFVSILVGQRILGKVGSVIMLFFFAVSPLIVAQSRFIWSSHPVTWLILLSLYFTYKIPEKSSVYAPLAIIFAGLTYHFQLGVALPLVVSIFVALVIVYRTRDILTHLYSVLAAIFVFFPMLLFEVRHGFMAVKSVISYLNHGSGIGISHVRLSGHFQNFLNNFENTFVFEFGWIPNYYQKLILYAFTIFIILYLIQVRNQKTRQYLLTIIVMVIVTWLGYLFLGNEVWDYYLTHLRVGYIILFSFVIDHFIRQSFSRRKVTPGLIMSVILIGSIIIGSVFRMQVSYAVDLYDNQVVDKIYGKRLIIDQIYKDDRDRNFSVFVFMPSIYTWPYDYLFKTYAFKKYGYIPRNVKSGTAYLIIEPDKSAPWRHQGWLETVVDGGNLVWEKTLLNGVILQKREY